EVAGREHDRLRVEHARLLPPLLSALLALSRRLVESRPDDRSVLVLAGDSGHVPVASQRAPDDLLERLAVPLLEGRALRLAVVREDDDLVGPRGVAAGALDAPEGFVKLTERLERVRPLDAGVVGDLVVAREGRVDRGPARENIRDHGVDGQVADDHAHR